ncbi:hypothetical protein BEP19_04990 [Ammoniphilus oxalaticus]|uniref:Uncharacterized protein n=1 Tax=Ammoniphilus oxalaticus TaxID=66863 RepID=A0A419SIK0_9BACL|nr:hypothetical protein [Ammoniphilus oxalaticus]RKD23787.1 hypothetical protein BEP19_04990 [Ammoniphilus oxalaticus]
MRRLNCVIINMEAIKAGDVAMKYITQNIMLLILAVGLGGCSLFQASPEEVEEYEAAFIKMADEAVIEAENGQKVLAEIRYKVDHEGLKKTKVLNTLSDGTDIAKAIKADVIRARIPAEWEPVRELWMESLDKRIEAYNELFRYYDFMDEKYKDSGEALLKESLEMFQEAQQQIEAFRK